MAGLLLGPSLHPGEKRVLAAQVLWFPCATPPCFVSIRFLSRLNASCPASMPDARSGTASRPAPGPGAGTAEVRVQLCSARSGPPFQRSSPFFKPNVMWGVFR